MFYFLPPLQVYLYPVPVRWCHTEEHDRSRGLIRVSASVTVCFVSAANVSKFSFNLSGSGEIHPWYEHAFYKSLAALWVYLALWHFGGKAELAHFWVNVVSVVVCMTGLETNLITSALLEFCKPKCWYKASLGSVYKHTAESSREQQRTTPTKPRLLHRWDIT